MAQLTFGTDGWRAMIAKDFTFANVRRVADALGRILPEKSPVVIGYDHRFLSERFAAEAGAVLAAQKHKVTLLSQATTSPALSFSLRKLRSAAGVMITASHNPPTYNGFKVKLPPGCSADPEFTRRLEGEIQTEAPAVPGDYPRKSYSPDDEYVRFLCSKLEKKFWTNARLRVVLDGMHGYGGVYWEKILAELKLKGAVIRSQRDPLFGGVTPEPIEKNLGALRDAVLQEKAAIGLAVDGDGDRLGAVDDKGEYLPPHHVFPLILLHLLENRKLSGKVVQTVSLGYVSERIAKKFGLKFVEVPVGFKHVVDQMRQAKVVLGGEESGGYGVGFWAPERDGLLSGLLLAELVLARRQPLSVLRKEMESRFGVSAFLRQDYPLKNVLADKKKWAEALSGHLPEKIAGTKVKELRTLDGLRIVLEDDSWLLLRPSGTEPLMRTYAESPDLKKTAQLLNKAQEICGMKVSINGQ